MSVRLTLEEQQRIIDVVKKLLSKKKSLIEKNLAIFLGIYESGLPAIKFGRLCLKYTK